MAHKPANSNKLTRPGQKLKDEAFLKVTIHSNLTTRRPQTTAHGAPGSESSNRHNETVIIARPVERFSRCWFERSMQRSTRVSSAPAWRQPDRLPRLGISNDFEE